MKIISFLALVGLVGCLTGPVETLAALGNWQTVDDFQYQPTFPAYGESIGSDAAGNIYAGIYIRDSTGTPHAIIRKGSAAGGWTTVDDLTADFGIFGIASDTAGNIYAVGGVTDAIGVTNRWIVRRSQDAGATWITVDTFAAGNCEAKAVAIDGAGNPYVVGYGGSSGQFWIVRKGTPGGLAWSTVDSFSSGASSAKAAFVHPSAGVFVAGSTRDGGRYGNVDRYRVRRSTDGGSTWTTVDTYQLDNSSPASAYGIGADAVGNIYTVGEAAAPSKSSSYYHWIVRKSATGTSFTTVDNFQPTATSSASATGFAKDGAGNLNVVGGGMGLWITRTSTGGTNWTTNDSFRLATGRGSYANGVTVDSFGNLFVIGSGTDAAATDHSLVRKR